MSTYRTREDLLQVDPATGKPNVVVPGEPVVADAPNRGALAGVESSEALRGLTMALQSLRVTTVPGSSVSWIASSATLTLTHPLTLNAVSLSGTPRKTIIQAGPWTFGENTLLAIPLALGDVDVTHSPSGTTPQGNGPTLLALNETDLAARLASLERSNNFKLRYVVFAKREGQSLRLINGALLRNGVGLDASWADAGYLGDAQFAALQSLVLRDRAVFVGGGAGRTISVSEVSNGQVTVTIQEGAVSITAPGLSQSTPTRYTNASSFALHIQTGIPTILYGRLGEAGSLTFASMQASLWTSQANVSDKIPLATALPSGRVAWITGEVMLPGGPSRTLGDPFEFDAPALAAQLAPLFAFDSLNDFEAAVESSDPRVAFIVDRADPAALVARLATRFSANAPQDLNLELVLRSLRADRVRLGVSGDSPYLQSGLDNEVEARTHDGGLGRVKAKAVITEELRGEVIEVIQPGGGPGVLQSSTVRALVLQVPGNVPDLLLRNSEGDFAELRSLNTSSARYAISINAPVPSAAPAPTIQGVARTPSSPEPESQTVSWNSGGQFIQVSLIFPPGFWGAEGGRGFSASISEASYTSPGMGLTVQGNTAGDALILRVRNTGGAWVNGTFEVDLSIFPGGSQWLETQ